MVKYIYIIVIVCIFGDYIYGQEVSSSVIATAGESVETGDVSVSWTLGEIAIETLGEDGSSVILTQGFQQGYFEITSIGEPLSNDFQLNVYPNPATEFIWIDLKSTEVKSAIVEIYNMEGKLVYNSKWEFVNGPNKIMLNKLNSSQYILRVSDSSGKVIQTFKLIKR